MQDGADAATASIHTHQPVAIKSPPAHHRRRFLEGLRARSVDAALSPAMNGLAVLLDADPILRMDLTQAIFEAQGRGYDLGFASIPELLSLMAGTITQAPPFDETSLVGCPINALLDPIMNMPSGYALFRSPSFNAALKAVLQEWCTFLSSAASTTYLNSQSPTGWFCPEALSKINMNLFVCNPAQPYYGFKSWNDYFTRLFVPGARPIASPNDTKVIVSACEASPFNVQSNLRLSDLFWMKSQAYSLYDIFTPARVDLARLYVGGDLYQAFLSADNYHRWHAPISGKISAAYNVDGTYYSDAEFAGYDPAGPNNSQGYLTAVASRAVIVIDSPDPKVGRVACVFVGMAEISSNVIGVSVGQQVVKGAQIGYFQYGGSTHCVIFQKGTIRLFLAQAPFDPNAAPTHLGAQIAFAN
jgi:phosphatidylserine decarboxylase